MDEEMEDTTAEDTTTETVEAAPLDAAADGGGEAAETAAEKPDPKAKGKTIPYERFQAENRKRQELERKVERLSGQIEAINQRPSIGPKEPELSDDEVWKQGPAKYIHATAKQIAEQAAFDARVALSIDAAEEKYEDWAEKSAYWREHHTVADEQAIRSQNNPAKWAYNWAKTRMEPPKSEEERYEEMKAKILADLRDEGVEVPAPKEKPKKHIPDTIAGKRSAGGSTVQSVPQTAVDMARAALATAHGGHARF